MPKPPPFQRPSVQIGKHGRQWADVAVESLKPGDNMPGLGLVLEVINREKNVKVICSGDYFTANYGTTVSAFVLKEQ